MSPLCLRWFALGLTSALVHCATPSERPAKEPPAEQEHADGISEGRGGEGDEPLDLTTPAPDVATADSDPLKPRPLRGPVASLDEYRAKHVQSGAQCKRARKKSSHGKRLGGREPMLGAETFRVDSDDCRAERCLFGIRTPKGWFVRESTAACAGALDGSARLETRKEHLSWVDTGNGIALALEYTTIRSAASAEGSDAGVSSASDAMFESRWLVLCGAGESGEPTCTSPVVLSCADLKGAMHEARWSTAEGNVTFESKSDPNSACAHDGPFVVGTFPLTFP
jgi:hypothetical protein